MKRDAIRALNRAVMAAAGIAEKEKRVLVDIQNKVLSLTLPPERGENWIRMQIEERWEALIHKAPFGDEASGEIYQNLGKLKNSLYLGRDPELLASYNSIPEGLKREWVDLIYTNMDRIDFQLLDRLIQILQKTSLGLPYQEKSRKSLIGLKGLAENIGQLEEKTNTVLRQVLNGHADVTTSYLLNNKIA